MRLIISLVMWLVCHIPQRATAQTDGQPYTEYHRYENYAEKTFCYGKDRDNCIVKRYLPDSSLNRVTTYAIVTQGMLNYSRDPTKVAVLNGPSEIYYPNGQVYIRSNYKLNQLDGPLFVFYADGVVKRRELYKRGSLHESHCYDSTGTQLSACEPLRQPAFYLESFNEFDKYLRQSLTPLLQNQQIYTLAIALNIDETGSLSRIDAIGRDMLFNLLAPDQQIKAQVALQRIFTELPKRPFTSALWKPATVDGLPVEDRWLLNVAQRNGIVYIDYPKNAYQKSYK